MNPSHTCPKCGPQSPKLRSSEQLAKHDWELHCASCGAQLKPAPTSEEKPIYPTSVYAISKQDLLPYVSNFFVGDKIADHLPVIKYHPIS